MTRATLDDIARGHVVPALETPRLDALAAQPPGVPLTAAFPLVAVEPRYLADANELHRVAPADEWTRYDAVVQRAIRVESERDAATQAASRATVAAEEALRLLGEVWQASRFGGLLWRNAVGERVEAALAAVGLLADGDRDPVAGDGPEEMPAHLTPCGVPGCQWAMPCPRHALAPTGGQMFPGDDAALAAVERGS